MSVHCFMLPASVVHVLSFSDRAENVLGIVLKFLCFNYKLPLQEYYRTCRAWKGFSGHECLYVPSGPSVGLE